eukprot:gene9878-10888_t
MAGQLARFCKRSSLNVANTYRLLSTTAPRRALIEKQNTKDVAIADKSEKNIYPVTGVPEELVKNRKVRIAVPARNAMQSGTYNTRNWTLSFDNQERWENPLMGWSSTSDPVSNLELNFNTREAAVAYAETQGWTYEIEEPVVKKVNVKNYGDNFSWNKRTRSSTK